MRSSTRAYASSTRASSPSWVLAAMNTLRCEPKRRRSTCASSRSEAGRCRSNFTLPVTCTLSGAAPSASMRVASAWLCAAISDTQVSISRVSADTAR